ncbi:Lnb N-terminal periplasmic domain-containing protein [Sulfurimonas sp.]
MKLNLYNERYWHLLLHMDDNLSEIDDPRFFFAKEGKTNPKAELLATIDAFMNSGTDDNSSVCKFPARYAWLKEKLNADEFVVGECKEYKQILKRVDPKSTTLVFPAAHINSPASMFGHTFLRINSSYNSRLLSYAINYAADANPDKENAVTFAIKGLVGGYFGKYSLLPYYDKLKEYRDSEQRDIWEYDLNLTQEETLQMFRHIWELNGTSSYYYFFTENCSYNMLWLLEVARPSLHLREYFHYQVPPMETVHVAQEEKLIVKYNYRPSKRTILLKYERLLHDETIDLPIELVASKVTAEDIMKNRNISIEQKRYILEAAIELLEYDFSKSKFSKEKYLKLFHIFTSKRATLGTTKALNIKTPPNPIHGHRAVRVELGYGQIEHQDNVYLGIRPAYHDLKDSAYGFLRGTQIEFLDLELRMRSNEIRFEKATILSISSIAQRSKFFKNFSWRTKFGWDNDFLDNKVRFYGGIGAGLSWGNSLGYIYFMIDPFVYDADDFIGAIGSSVGFKIDKYKWANLNFEATQRFYDNGYTQRLLDISSGVRTTQNTQILLQYNYKDKYYLETTRKEETFKVLFKYFF